MFSQTFSVSRALHIELFQGKIISCEYVIGFFFTSSGINI